MSDAMIYLATVIPPLLADELVEVRALPWAPI